MAALKGRQFQSPGLPRAAAATRGSDVPHLHLPGTGCLTVAVPVIQPFPGRKFISPLTPGNRWRGNPGAMGSPPLQGGPKDAVFFLAAPPR
jgi:hypothetical protein